MLIESLTLMFKIVFRYKQYARAECLKINGKLFLQRGDHYTCIHVNYIRNYI